MNHDPLARSPRLETAAAFLGEQPEQHYLGAPIDRSLMMCRIVKGFALNGVDRVFGSRSEADFLARVMAEALAVIKFKSE